MPADLRPKAVLFDVYNTLIDIRTREHDPAVWRQLSRFLQYQGVRSEAAALHDAYFAAMRVQQQERGESYPEIDVVALFQQLLDERGYRGPDHFAVHLTQLFRALSIRRFGAYPETLPTLRALRPHVKLGLVSDAQVAFLDPELSAVGVHDLFDVRIVSAEHGFRKPDARLFHLALARLGVGAEEAIYVGDNLYRDIEGAQAAGLRAVLVQRRDPPPDHPSTAIPDRIIQSLAEIVGWLK